MQVIVCDGIIEIENPIGICGYIDIPLRQWAENWALT
jgi:hypothetical protein